MMVARLPGSTRAASARKAPGSALRAAAPRATSAFQARSCGCPAGAGSMCTTCRSRGRRPASSWSFASWTGVETIAATASEFSRMKRHCSAVSEA